MNITQFAIDKKRITLAIILVIIISGLIAYSSMSRDEYPSFTIRTAMIATYFPGASPERVESLITDKLEKAIQAMPELDELRSESKPGASIIYVDIKKSYKTMRPIWDDLRRKVDAVVGDLPSGIYGPFVNDDFGDVYGIMISITGEDFSYAELKDAADDARDEFLRLPQVAKVSISGDQEERVFVEYNNARLAEAGISPAMLVQLLQARNIISPGGNIRIGDERIALEPTGNFNSIEDIENTVIAVPGKRDLFYLKDLATISRGYVDPASSKFTSSGTPALCLGLSMKDGGNNITMGEETDAALAHLRSKFPYGIEFDVIEYQPQRVKESIDDFTMNLIQAIIIVGIVLLVSLGFRTGIIIAMLIPLVLLVSMLIMLILGIGLDMISLGAMIVALGMLVDNGIVISESIVVQMERGKKGKEAAIKSVKELMWPLLTSSLITSAAFLPIFLAESDTGEYAAGLFKVVAITLLSSWVLALTVVPFLCVWLVKVKKTKTEGDTYNSLFYKAYRGFLQLMLRWRFVTILVVVGIFMVAMWAFQFVPVMFFPKDDNTIFQAEIKLPMGTSIEATESAVTRLDGYLKQRWLINEEREEGLTNWASFIGEGAPRYLLTYSPEPPSSEYAYIVLNASSYDLMQEMITDIDRWCVLNIPDAITSVEMMPMGPPSDNPVEIRVLGKETDTLFNLVEEIQDKLAAIPGTKNITNNWGLKTKKVVVDVDEDRALRAGLTSMDIAVSLQAGLSGIPLTDYREGDKLIPIMLRAESDVDNEIEKMFNMNVYSLQSGNSVPLAQVADISLAWQPSKIRRQDRLRVVKVSSALAPGGDPFIISAEIDAWLQDEAKHWPNGYRYEIGGEPENSGDANKSIMEKLPYAGIIILLLLIMQFDSFRKPMVILLTIPLALIGVVVGLLLTGAYMGFMAFLGIISLAGIVVYNAVVLLERIKIENEETGLSLQNAIISAAQQRLRPILLTAITTIAGLAILWISGGPLWQSMAITVVFGLLFAAVLTLGVVPVLYSIFYSVSYKNHKFES
jgi:multidrug efflux pump